MLIRVTFLLTMFAFNVEAKTPVIQQTIAKGSTAYLKNILATQAFRINSRDASNRTALHYAAEYGNRDIVEALIARGADPGLKDNDDKTAYVYAADKARHSLPHAAIVATLLGREGGSWNRDTKGWTALDWAALSGDQQLIQGLIEQGAWSLTALDIALQHHGEEMFVFLAKASAEANISYSHGANGNDEGDER